MSVWRYTLIPTYLVFEAGRKALHILLNGGCEVGICTHCNTEMLHNEHIPTHTHILSHYACYSIATIYYSPHIFDQQISRTSKSTRYNLDHWHDL